MNVSAHPAAPLPAVDTPILRVQSGTHHDPFEVLGTHLQSDGSSVLRTFLPAAEAVEVDDIPLTRVPGTDCFEGVFPKGATLETHPVLRWQDKQSGAWHTLQSPYSFAPQLGEMDIYLCAKGAICRRGRCWAHA